MRYLHRSLVRRVAVCVLTVAALSICTVISEPAAPPSSRIDVFVNGVDSYPIFRIPTVVRTRAGTLLAFAEGRAAKADGSENDIVLKRSNDDGASWSQLQVVAEDGANSLNNPTAVVVRESGRILLMYQRYPKGAYEYDVIPGLTGNRICRGFITHSDDDGATWSKPEDITTSVKRPTLATSIASGPGIGIELAHGKLAGRILIPFNEGPIAHGNVYAVFSDNRGLTWKYGNTAPCESKGRPNEVQMVELGNGSVMLNARNQGGPKMRKTAISSDGGETWSPVTDNPDLVEPQCEASLIRHSMDTNFSHDVLLFANPFSNSRRTNGTVRLSRDDGATWPISRALVPSSFGYNCLVSLDPNTVGCLFEHDSKGISFMRFNLDWLAAGAKTADK